MKKTKLLMPLLGLGTVASIIAPVATSCGNNATHVKYTEFTEKELDDNKTATFLLVLDNDNYKENGFVVKTTVPTTNADVKDDDFATSFEVDGKFLRVHVKHVGAQTFDSVQKIKLNINIKYLTNWEQNLDVTLKVGSSMINMKYESRSWEGSDPDYAFYDTKKLETGKNYTYYVDMSKITGTYYEPKDFYMFTSGFEEYQQELGKKPYTFESAEVTVDDLPLEEGVDFTYFTLGRTEKICGLEIIEDITDLFTVNTKIKITIKNVVVEDATQSSFMSFCND